MTIDRKMPSNIFKILNQIVVTRVTLLKLFESLIILFQYVELRSNIALNPCVTYIRSFV